MYAAIHPSSYSLLGALPQLGTLPHMYNHESASVFEDQLPSDDMYSSHHCINDLGEVGEMHTDRRCVFNNVCVSPEYDGGSAYFTSNQAPANFYDHPTIARLHYYHRPKRLPVGVTTTGRMQTAFGDRYFVQLAPCRTPPRCHVMRLADNDGPLNHTNVQYIRHRVGLMAALYTWNPGHLLGDYMLGMHTLQLELGLTLSYDFQMMSTCEPMEGERDVRTIDKFMPGFAKYPFSTLSGLARRRRRGNAAATTICFRQLVMGTGDFIGAKNRNTLSVPLFRAWMLRGFNLQWNAQPTRQRVTVFAKELVGTHGRGIVNAQQVCSALSAQLNDAVDVVCAHNFANMSAHDELDLMLHTTVFVTPGGSGGSYGAIFMPKGAVYLGLDIVDAHGQSVRFNDRFFSQLSGLHDYQYPMTRAEYSTHYTLNTSRLLDAVRLALLQVEIEHPRVHELTALRELATTFSAFRQTTSNLRDVDVAVLRNTWWAADEKLKTHTPQKCALHGDWRLCPEWTNCSLITVGVGNDWKFEDAAASPSNNNCSVLAIDPTTRLRAKHESHQRTNIDFRFAGLIGANRSNGASASPYYGNLARPSDSVPYYTIAQLVNAAKHQRRSRTQTMILKIDCEGCEWAAFADADTTAALKHVDVLMIEVHFSVGLQMSSWQDVRLIPVFFSAVIDSGLLLTRVQPNDGLNWPGSFPILPELLEFGFPPKTCCFNLQFERQ